MKHLPITTIAVVLLAGCGTLLLQKPAETKSTVADAKAIKETAKVEVPGIAIHRAAWKGDIQVVEKHLAAGTNVDAKNKWESTALHYTARGGQAGVAELLISKNANVNGLDADGMTPLHLSLIHISEPTRPY